MSRNGVDLAECVYAQSPNNRLQIQLSYTWTITHPTFPVISPLFGDPDGWSRWQLMLESCRNPTDPTKANLCIDVRQCSTGDLGCARLKPSFALLDPNGRPLVTRHCRETTIFCTTFRGAIRFELCDLREIRSALHSNGPLVLQARFTIDCPERSPWRNAGPSLPQDPQLPISLPN